MFDTRIGRIMGLLVVIGLVVAAISLFRAHRERKVENVGQFDRNVAQEIYQQKAEQMRIIMSEVGER